jgi:hypothetical protein
MYAFEVHPQKKPAAPARKADVQKPRRKWRRWVGLLLLLLLIGGAAWAARPNPHLARAKELQTVLFSPEAKNLSPEERKAKFEQYRAAVKQLNDDQKWELSAPMREKQKAEMDRYFAMTPQEKVKHLDALIDRAEKARKEWEQRQKAGKAGGGPGKGPGGGPGGPGGGFGFGPPGGGGGGGGGKAGGPGGRPRTPDEIESRKKKALDRTTPEERAQRDQFRRDLENRRKQRGLPVNGR